MQHFNQRYTTLQLEKYKILIREIQHYNQIHTIQYTITIMPEKCRSLCIFAPTSVSWVVFLSSFLVVFDCCLSQFSHPQTTFPFALFPVTNCFAVRSWMLGTKLGGKTVVEGNQNTNCKFASDKGFGPG